MHTTTGQTLCMQQDQQLIVSIVFTTKTSPHPQFGVVILSLSVHKVYFQLVIKNRTTQKPLESLFRAQKGVSTFVILSRRTNNPVVLQTFPFFVHTELRIKSQVHGTSLLEPTLHKMDVHRITSAMSSWFVLKEKGRKKRTKREREKERKNQTQGFTHSSFKSCASLKLFQTT